MKEYNFELSRLRNENNQMRTKNLYLNKNLMDLIEENTKLINRIENLENVFVKQNNNINDLESFE